MGKYLNEELGDNRDTEFVGTSEEVSVRRSAKYLAEKHKRKPP